MRVTKWDKRFLQLAELVSTWSKDPSTKVGAVIVDDAQRIISTGYNGPPRGVMDLPEYSREEKLMRTIHAEENAILFARQSLVGTTLYVTHPPCAHCTAKIIQVGIEKIVYLEPDEMFYSRWRNSHSVAQSMLSESNRRVYSVCLESLEH